MTNFPDRADAPEPAAVLPSEFTPELTPDLIARVQEGVAIARNPVVRSHITNDIAALSAIAAGQPTEHVDGHVRRWLLRRFIKTFFRVQVENSHYIPTQPTILVANHLSHLDPFLLLALVPPSPYYYILGDARTLYNQAWKRSLLGWAGGVIPLERWWKEEVAVMAAAAAGCADLQALATAIAQDVPNGSSIHQMRQIDQAVQALLRQGDGIMLFPEGRLGEQEGQLHRPLKRGTVLYAMRSGVPISPVAIIGTKDLYWRKRLIVRFGPPVEVPHQPRPKRVAIDTVLHQVDQALSQLLPTVYQEPPGPKWLRHWLNHLFW